MYNKPRRDNFLKSPFDFQREHLAARLKTTVNTNVQTLLRTYLPFKYTLRLSLGFSAFLSLFLLLDIIPPYGNHNRPYQSYEKQRDNYPCPKAKLLIDTGQTDVNLWVFHNMFAIIGTLDKGSERI